LIAITAVRLKVGHVMELIGLIFLMAPFSTSKVLLGNLGGFFLISDVVKFKFEL
jgi:hypothetical protein